MAFRCPRAADWGTRAFIAGSAVIQHAVVPLTDEILDKIPDWLNSLHNIDAADRTILPLSAPIRPGSVPASPPRRRA